MKQKPVGMSALKRVFPSVASVPTVLTRSDIHKIARAYTIRNGLVRGINTNEEQKYVSCARGSALCRHSFCIEFASLEAFSSTAKEGYMHNALCTDSSAR